VVEAGATEGGYFRKDANEVLVKDGPTALEALVRQAQPYPIRGLFKFSDFLDEIEGFYALGRTDEVGCTRAVGKLFVVPAWALPVPVSIGYNRRVRGFNRPIFSGLSSASQNRQHSCSASAPTHSHADRALAGRGEHRVVRARPPVPRGAG
jgi:hypothetical protein